LLVHHLLIEYNGKLMLLTTEPLPPAAAVVVVVILKPPATREIATAEVVEVAVAAKG
jgi:hypothetical protein